METFEKMSATEICRRYRTGIDDKKKMVHILADLNGVDPNEIVNILFANGELTEKQIETYRRSGRIPAAEVKKIKKTRKVNKPMSTTKKYIAAPDCVIKAVSAELEKLEPEYLKAKTEMDEVLARLKPTLDEYEQLLEIITKGIPA